MMFKDTRLETRHEILQFVETGAHDMYAILTILVGKEVGWEVGREVTGFGVVGFAVLGLGRGGCLYVMPQTKTKMLKRMKNDKKTLNPDTKYSEERNSPW
jgi:hypothetical protein